MSANIPSESTVALRIMSIVLSLSHILSLDQEAQRLARACIDDHSQKIGEATVPPWPGDVPKNTIPQGVYGLLDDWSDNVVFKSSSHATNEQTFCLPVKDLNTHVIRKVYEPESIEVDIFEIKAPRRRSSATHRWLPSLVPHAKLYEIDIRDSSRNELSCSSDGYVDQAVEGLLHSIHRERIKNLERPVLFITHGECSNVLRQVLSTSESERASTSAQCESLFGRTLGIIESGWGAGIDFAMSSEDELRETTQQARFLTPDQLIYSQTQRHDSKILQAAAAVCIDCFTLLYILARIWSHLVFTDSTTAASIPPFFPIEIPPPASSNERLYLGLLWSCWTLALHHLHSTDQYQDHCLFLSILISSASGFFGADDPWDFFTRHLFWGVIVGLLISAVGHRWLRRT